MHPHFDLAGLIDLYGYYAVAVGAFLEGETVLALAGFAAYRGYLDFWTVCAVAATCGFLGDQCYFFLGRHQGCRVLARFPGAEARAQRFDAMLARWHAPLIIGIRFMYGFRILGPVMLGMGRVPAWKFMVFNFIGAAIWAPLITAIGYLFGSALQSMLRDLKHVEEWAVGAIVVIGLGICLIHWLRGRSHRKKVPVA